MNTEHIVSFDTEATYDELSVETSATKMAISKTCNIRSLSSTSAPKTNVLNSWRAVSGQGKERPEERTKTIMRTTERNHRNETVPSPWESREQDITLAPSTEVYAAIRMDEEIYENTGWREDLTTVI